MRVTNNKSDDKSFQNLTITSLSADYANYHAKEYVETEDCPDSQIRMIIGFDRELTEAEQREFGTAAKAFVDKFNLYHNLHTPGSFTR